MYRVLELGLGLGLGLGMWVSSIWSGLQSWIITYKESARHALTIRLTLGHAFGLKCDCTYWCGAQEAWLKTCVCTKGEWEQFPKNLTFKRDV